MADIGAPLFVLLLGAGMAGFVDAVVGGGGLIQIPLLFNLFPAQTPATLFGTNKLSSVFGTASAAYRYTRRVVLDWTVLGPAAAMAFACAWLGARSVSLVPVDVMRPLVLVLLMVMAIYTFMKKDFGLASGVHAKRLGTIRVWTGSCVGGLIGFYDGFFGPGTGSFLIFLFIRVFGADFLQASASAKVVNVATNIAALLWFGRDGSVLWQLAFAMAAFNVAGAQLGSRLALRHGTRFVRQLFLIVVWSLILRLGYDLLG